MTNDEKHVPAQDIQQKTPSLSRHARKNLQRNYLLRTVRFGIRPIPRLEHSNPTVVLDPELIEPVEHEVNGKKVILLRYIVFVSDDHQVHTFPIF
jgi:hypothetical protein